MKKIFTSFLMLMLCAISMNAQYKPVDSVEPVPGENYLFTHAVDGTSYYMTYKGAMQAFCEDASFLWQIEEAGDGNYYLKSGDTGLYIQEYDQVKLSEDQGGYPFDGYDLFGYAGFNFEMGEKATAMKITITGENGEYTLTRTQTVPAMAGYGYDVFALAIQNNGGNINVAMEPWKSGHTWGFYTYSDKDIFEILADLAEQCDYYQFVAGTTFGYYDAEKVAAYEAALKAAHEADDPSLTEEDAQKIYDNLAAALEAVQKAFIRIPAGYYRVVSGLAGFVQNQGETAVKAMYESDGKGYWKDLEADNASMLWKIAPDASSDEAYTMVNAHSGMHYSTVGQSAAISLTDAEDGVLTMIEIAGYDEEGNVQFDIRPASSSKGGYGYVHCGGHGGGSGTSGTLVGWCNTFDAGSAGASEWMLLPVSDEEVEAIINAAGDKDKQDALNNELKALIQTAWDRYHATGTYVQGDGLITDAAQFSSNATEPNEGSIEALIDGDASTFWHSQWSAGSVPGNSHYLQVDLINPVEQEVELYVLRRIAADDHVKVLTVEGSNDDENYSYVTTLTLENATSGAAFTTAPFSTGGYRYLRFWITDTYYSGGSTRGYAHFAEFQLYPVSLEPGCQLDRIKDEAVTKALLEAIATAQAVENATQADIDALQAAIDAFAAISVDPSDLTNLIATVGEFVGKAQVGTNPGYVTEEALNKLEAEYEKAQVLLTSSYTADDIKAALAALQAAYDAAAPIAIVPGKWYSIRWNDKYWTYPNTLGDDPTAQEAQFRFIPLDEGRVAIQNRKTGLTAHANGTYHYMGAGFQDVSRYTPEYQGDGTTEFSILSWTGDDYGYIEVYSSANIVSHKGGKTALYVEEVEADGEEDELSTTLTFTANAAFILTLPTGITGVSETGTAYNVLGCYTDEEGLKLAMNEVNFDEAIVAPGEPFLIMPGSFDAEVDTTTANAIPVALRFGDNIAMEPVAVENGLVGTYTALTGVKDAIVIADGRPTFTSAPAAVSAFRGYIQVVTEVEENAGEINILVPGTDENFEVGIKEALANVAKAGVVYNMSGMVVAKNATLKDLKALGRGTYILNGVKVMIK